MRSVRSLGDHPVYRRLAVQFCEYDALRKANTAGVMFLAAAGNFGTDNDSIPFFPSGYSVATPCGPALPNVISVTAITQTGDKADFSNFGATSVQIAAPGVNTNSTKPTNNTADLLLHHLTRILMHWAIRSAARTIAGDLSIPHPSAPPRA